MHGALPVVAAAEEADLACKEANNFASNAVNYGSEDGTKLGANKPLDRNVINRWDEVAKEMVASDEDV